MGSFTFSVDRSKAEKMPVRATAGYDHTAMRRYSAPVAITSRSLLKTEMTVSGKSAPVTMNTAAIPRAKVMRIP